MSASSSWIPRAHRFLLQRGRSGRPARPTRRPRTLRLESLEPRLALAVYTFQEPTALFGTLDQHSLSFSYPQFGSGAASIACGPAAGTNSLVYL